MTVTVLTGDCRDVLPTLPADSFDCIVTSPPYFGLRDYGVDGQIGLEPTLDGYIDAIAGVASELGRVLKPAGTFWLNLGDCYNAHPGQRKVGDKTGEKQATNNGALGAPSRFTPGLKPKDLCMVPARVALRLQADGWWLRSEIIWHKPNPMPESVTDRPTAAHEKVYLLTKGERYLYDAAAIAEPLESSSIARLAQNVESQEGSDRANGGGKTNGKMKAVYKTPYLGQATKDFEASGAQNASDVKRRIVDRILSGEIVTRNARNVWTIASQPFKGAHFATMPPELAERCIKAGCPVGGHVLDPFGGAGTAGLVADRLGRDATLIELNPAYVEMQVERLAGDAPLLSDIKVGA